MAFAISSNKRSTADPFKWTLCPPATLCVALRADPRRALPRLRLYYKSVRLPLRLISALLLQLVEDSRLPEPRPGLSLRQGSPKFRRKLIDYPPRSQTPACIRMLTFFLRILRCWFPDNELFDLRQHRSISGLNPFTCVVADRLLVYSSIPFVASRYV
jgi:hypothetical protein